MINTRPSLPVSIVIPVRNEASTISETLGGILALSTLPSEIIFVDTGSTDKSVSMIESWSSRAAQMGIRFKLIHHPDGYPGAARNTGVKAASFEWIAFLDVGIKPEADWLGKLWDCMHASKAEAVYGMCQFFSEHPFGRLICAASYGQDNLVPVLPASLFHKDVFAKAGYFEEHLRSGEDILWNQHVAKGNIPTAVCTDSKVYYQHFPANLWTALKKWFIYEQSATVAGLGSLSKTLMFFAIALIYACILSFGYHAVFALFPYLFVRGVLDPFRRAGHKIWWQFWWQPVAIIPVVALLDISSILGRITAWTGLSKFKLHGQTIQSSPEYNDHILTPFRVCLFLGLIFFCYSTIAALLFQNVVLPWQSHLHAGNGLLIGDSEFFHSAAVHLAENIALHGWRIWQIFPQVNAYGNVGVAGAVYAIFGSSPSYVIPVNAAVHALSGVMIYMIVNIAGGEGRYVRTAGLISAALFVLFPTALNWYGQLHKDGYAILGMLFILWAWLMIAVKPFSLVHCFKVLAVYSAGIVLVGLARPYALKLLLIISCCTILLHCVSFKQIQQQQKNNKKWILICLFVVLNVLAIGYFAQLLSVWGDPNLQSGGENYSNWTSAKGWAWHHTAWLPVSLDIYFEMLAKTRVGLIEFGVSEGARSMMDVDETPNNLYSLLMYIPRALQISLFAPFPISWFKSSGLVHLVAVLEMCVLYFAMTGLLFLNWRQRWPSITVVLLFAVFLLVVYGITTSNLGTLYRLRYFSITLLMSLGILGWFTLLEKYRNRNHRAFLNGDAKTHLFSEEDMPLSQERKMVLSSGLLVFIMTLIGFVGFFFRDLLLASRFGLSSDLDDFYLALLLPMFAVSVLSIPAGSAFTPVYLKLISRKEPLQASFFAKRVIKRITEALVIISIFLALLTPVTLQFFGLSSEKPSSLLLSPVHYFAICIFLMSGAVVIGNAALNAHGYFKISTAAQLVVPATSFFLIYCLSDYGVIVAMSGMLLGQAINLIIVFFFLRRLGLLQKEHHESKIFRAEERELLANYLPLMASALFISMVIPFSSLLALRLPEGSLSALGLGTKVVMFITGLIGAVLNIIMLPYFSSLVAREKIGTARRELSFYMLLSVFVSVPLTVIIFIFAFPVTGLIFNVGHLQQHDLEAISKVMQYGLIQVPFFICNTLMLKFVIATRHIKIIWLAAILGLLGNLVLSMILSKYMGVAGIVLGASLATLLSTLLIFFFLYVRQHVLVFDALIIGIALLLYMAVIACLHFKNILGVCCCTVGLLVLLLDYMRHIKQLGADKYLQFAKAF